MLECMFALWYARVLARLKISMSDELYSCVSDRVYERVEHRTSARIRAHGFVSRVRKNVYSRIFPRVAFQVDGRISNIAIDNINE